MGGYVEIISKSTISGVDLLILVLLGTQDKSFARLIKLVEEGIQNGIIHDKVVVQSGATKYQSQVMDIFDYISMDEMTSYIKNSDLIITHAGVGSIVESLKLGKKVIAMPRLKKYKEHTNDHQKQIVETFSSSGYIVAWTEEKTLKECLLEVAHLTVKPFVSNSDAFRSRIKEDIDKLLK